MPRTSQLLHPVVPPAPLRMAATVLLLRDGAQGMEVLLTQRSAHAGFAAQLHVFPGGAVDTADGHAAQALLAATGQTADAHALEARTWALAAIREAFEEVGVLLARHANGRSATQADVDALHTRIGRRANASAFYTHLAALGLHADVAALRLLARWVAPLDLPKRFDTPFFAAAMPAGQTPIPDAHEQTSVCWLHPATALHQHRQQRIAMMFPTWRTLEKITPYTSTALLLESLQENTPQWTYQPRAALQAGREVRITHDNAAYGEVGLVAPHGQAVHRIDWQHTQPVPLLRNLQRLTAPNSGTKTGAGTNSYVLGTPASGYGVVDPGPAQAAHIQRLHAATQGDVRWIVCTHSHPDHSPGAALLQQLCQRHHGHTPPIYGMRSGPHASADSHFVPDIALADGDTLTLTEPPHPPHSTTPTTHTLRALHTPGHTANHLCLLLEEDGLLLSGDHILGGSTSMVSPPDGHMGDYIASLDTLSHAVQHAGVSHILPAHGHAIEQPLAHIAHLKAHRLAREAKVRHAMHTLPHGTPDDWVALAYADTPPHLWPLARHSLLAHVQHLQETGQTPCTS